MSEEQINPIEDAKSILAKIESEKAELQKLVERNEQLHAENMLSGRSSANIPQPAPKSREEQIQERVNNLLRPTGMKI